MYRRTKKGFFKIRILKDKKTYLSEIIIISFVLIIIAMESKIKNSGGYGLYFQDAPGGTGKTFLIFFSDR